MAFEILLPLLVSIFGTVDADTCYDYYYGNYKYCYNSYYDYYYHYDSSFIVGPIVGGLFGFGFLVTIIVVIICCRRRMYYNGAIRGHAAAGTTFVTTTTTQPGMVTQPGVVTQPYVYPQQQIQVGPSSYVPPPQTMGQTNYAVDGGIAMGGYPPSGYTAEAQPVTTVGYPEGEKSAAPPSSAPPTYEDTVKTEY